MMHQAKLLRLFPIIILLFLGKVEGLMAQTDLPAAMRFNGLGRTLINSTEFSGTMAEGDTTTSKNLLDGEFLLDLKINASPNEKTEVQSILRLRNEFGGFFGAGMSIEVRELFARGVVADVFRYHVGDMDLKMTPFTLFQYEEEGQINEAEIFRARKEVIDYEQFYTDENTRRMQGGKFELGLTAGAILPEINFTGFFTRVRGTDFFTLPSRYVGGGSVELGNYTWGSLTANYVNTFDSRSIGNFSTGIRNPVQTLSADISIFDKEDYKLSLKGEGGMSRITEVTDSIVSFEESDTFLEALVEFDWKPKKLRFTLGFRDVGPDFFSIAAQSKRVDFNRRKAFFHRIGNEQGVRPVGLFDLNRDRNLYTFSLSDNLRAYDPRLSNALPYGRATANRIGFWLGLDHGDEEESAFHGSVEFNLMREIRGQGTFELKTFNLLRVEEDVHFHRLFDLKQILTLTLGYQYEQTSRGGNEIEAVNLSSNLIETGLQVELFDKFDLLLGAKILMADGSDYIPEIRRFNTIRDFPGRTTFSDTESLLGAGIRYRFRDGIYLSIQWDRFSFASDENPDGSYRIDQPFILYNMNF